jgi:hypothetical protein
LIDEKPSHQFNETISHHHLYPEITRDIKKSSQKSK